MKRLNEIFSRQQFQNILVGLGLVFLIIAGYLYLKPGKEAEEKEIIPEEVIVQEEGVVKKRGETVEEINQEELERLQEEIDGVLATGGETADLTGTAGVQAKGQAKRAYSDGRFYLKITSSGLMMPAKGYYYQGWLKQDDQYHSVGRLQVESNNEAVLYYTASTDKSDYSEAMVTREAEDGDASPGQPVLTGEF